jgi:SNF2 family DNA or RNA helicase
LKIQVESNKDVALAYRIGTPYEINGFVEARISLDTMSTILAHKHMITHLDEKVIDAFEFIKNAERMRRYEEEQRRKAIEQAEARRKIKVQKLEQKRQQEALKRKQAEDRRQEFLSQELIVIREAREIKNRFKRDPASFKSNPIFNAFLMPHQIAGCEIAALFDKYAFFYDTGTGKTVLALEIITRLFEKTRTKFLVICPKTIINTAWMADCEQFYSTFRLLPMSKNIKPEQYRKIYKKWNETAAGENYERLYYDDFTDGNLADRIEFILSALVPRASAYIINPESFDVDFFLTLGINGLVVDESAMLKNYYSKISEKVRDFSSKMKYSYLLSGKPAPNRVQEYYSQMRVVDRVYLNRSFDVYSRTHDIAKDVDRKSFTLSKEDCIDLPPKSYVIRSVSLDRDVRSKYNEMLWSWRTEYIKDLKERRNVAVGHHLSVLRKLRQIASGFVVDSVVDKKTAHWIHSSKERELEDVLDDLGSNQAIIWAQHHYEIEAIEKLLRKRGEHVVTAYGKTADKDYSIEAFKKGAARYIVAHPRTLMYGATLTNCTYAIYYSTSYSFEEFYQSHDRIYRIGQNKPCTYIFIQAENTIDEIMYDCIFSKKTESEFFETLLKSIDN